MKNKNNVDYTLYLCTDRGLMTTGTVEESVRLAIAGGCGVVQLREKEISSAEFYRLAVNTKKITDEAGAALIINDRVDIALAADADGVHVGQSDLPAAVVRRLIGPGKQSRRQRTARTTSASARCTPRRRRRTQISSRWRNCGVSARRSISRSW